MNLLDFPKALGLALLLMVLNVAIAFGVVWVYSVLVEPGHDEAFYMAAAQDIAPWSSVVAGALIFFAAAWLLAWRRAGRNGYFFAGAAAAIYAVIDVSVIAAAGGLGDLGAIVAVSMLGKFSAALLGAWVARPKS